MEREGRKKRAVVDIASKQVITLVPGVIIIVWGRWEFWVLPVGVCL